MKLFDDIKRDDASPAAYGEHSFAFMNRADGIVWQRIRDALDDWFTDYPPEHAADLRGKFRSKHPGAHWGAWWELYLHRLFTRLDYIAVVHPNVLGSSKQPDFELSRGDERLYLEAAVVFSGIVDKERDGTREGWIMDAVDRGTSPNFHVQIEFESLGVKRPPDREIYRPLEDWLASLDPDQVSEDYAEMGSLPETTIVIDDWQLRFEALPVTPEARREKEPGRLLGIGPMSAGCVDDQQQLRDTLKHKRGGYGTPEIPLLVAVDCASSFMKDDDVANALYGSFAVQYQMGVPGSGKPIRQRDGTWMGGSGPCRFRQP